MTFNSENKITGDKLPHTFLKHVDYLLGGLYKKAASPATSLTELGESHAAGTVLDGVIARPRQRRLGHFSRHVA